MIYTSYFAKLKTLPVYIVPVSICGKAPDSYRGLRYKKLAPKWSFFQKWKESQDNDYYSRCFREQVLSVLDPVRVRDELIALAGSQDIALICYEKPEAFCHRHLVVDWLNAAGIPAQEYSFSK